MNAMIRAFEILARLVFIEIIVFFLFWWKTIAHVIFDGMRFRATKPIEHGFLAALSVTFSILPVLVLSLLSLFAIPKISQRTSATFLTLLFALIAPVALFSVPVSHIPLATFVILATLTCAIYRSSHSRCTGV